MAEPTQAQRQAWAKMGWAMPDGSYYIRPDHPEDLTNAIHAIGRSTHSSITVRKHIIARAKALGKTSELPDTWNPDGSLKHGDLVQLGRDFLAHTVPTFTIGTLTPEQHDVQAKEHRDLASKFSAQHDQVQAKGLDSDPAKQAYGSDAKDMDRVAFQKKHGVSKMDALYELKSQLRQAMNFHGRQAEEHSRKAGVQRQTGAVPVDSDLAYNDSVGEVLAHFGVKGMKWGVRRGVGTPRAPSSEDKARADELAKKVKVGGGHHVLSNKELEDLTKRMNLEQQYSRLDVSDVKRGEDAVKSGLGKVKLTLDAIDTGKRVYQTVQDAQKLTKK
jgi:hypothetical protein